MGTKKKKLKKTTSLSSPSTPTPRVGALLLSDGSLWEGFAYGAKTSQVGECVFHTGHQGYQEILTDPSYRRQILIFSAPQIGNQGYAEADFESSRMWASGAICRDYSEAPYHWRKEKSLHEVLESEGLPLLSGVNTRALILHLREKGNLWGVISTETADPRLLKKHLKASLSMEGLSLTQEVSTANAYSWTEPSHDLLKNKRSTELKAKKGLRKCVVMDFGVKRQILRYLIDEGFEEVRVVPALTTAEEILALKPDAVLLSNGPGDPAAEASVIEEVKKLHGRVPLFGICLGHQILGLSLGLKTAKLKFGHHAANHPVMNRESQRVEITSQNHGFAVLSSTAVPEVEITSLNLNDQTVAGFRHRRLKITALQFHPEAAPGPLDSTSAFQFFQSGEWM